MNIESPQPYASHPKSIPPDRLPFMTAFRELKVSFNSASSSTHFAFILLSAITIKIRSIITGFEEDDREHMPHREEATPF